MDKDWFLQVTEVNHLDNAFYTLGGSGWDSEAEARSEYARILSIPWVSETADLEYSLDLLDASQSLIDNKAITRDTAASLLGGDFEAARKAGRDEVAALVSTLALL